jgi:hypothetical protein
MPRPAVHPLLIAAHEAFRPGSAKSNRLYQSLTTWNLPHLGGPQPTVPRRVQAELVLWCAELMAPFMGAQRERFVALLAEVRDPLRPDWQNSLAELRRFEDRAVPDDPRTLAGLAAIAAKRIVTRSLRNAHRTAIEAVDRTVRVLRAAPEVGVMTAEAFIDALDDRLLRAEWSAFADRTQRMRELHAEAGARLDALLYRAGDDKGDGVVWVARVKSAPAPSIAALVRHHGFQYAEGTPDAALAIVPDAYLASAAAAVLPSAR